DGMRDWSVTGVQRCAPPIYRRAGEPLRVRKDVASGCGAQAIYGFRAAPVRNILSFPERFPGTTIVRLERNYRSSQPILDVSNAVISVHSVFSCRCWLSARVDGEAALALVS